MVPELQAWITDPAHQLGWVLQTMSGGEFPITDAMLAKRAALGRRIADRARELGIAAGYVAEGTGIGVGMCAVQ